MDLMESRPHRLAMLAQMIYVGCGLSTWLYAEDGHLYFSTSSHSRELDIFWELGGCKEFAMTTGKTSDKPFVMSDSLGFVWVGEYANVTAEIGRSLVLVGPMFHSETTAKTVSERMREQGMALSMQSACRRILADIPVLPIPTMNQYIRMLHFAITSQPVTPEEYLYQSDFLRRPGEEDAPQPQEDPHPMDYETAHLHEQMIMQCVREGNIHYEKLLENHQMQRPPKNYMTGNPLREAKDILIIFVSKCSQAAMEGGLPLSTAKKLETHAIRRIEACTRLTDLILLRQQVLEEYIRRVHALWDAPGVSQPILTCCDYVRAHFMEPIELTDIAKAVCYNEYYLSRKFQKEMGIQLRDYIRNVRLDYAKVLLLNSEKSVREISELLQFGTRNYFSRVFRERVGMTPTKYRESAGFSDIS